MLTISLGVPCKIQIFFTGHWSFPPACPYIKHFGHTLSKVISKLCCWKPNMCNCQSDTSTWPMYDRKLANPDYPAVSAVTNNINRIMLVKHNTISTYRMSYFRVVQRRSNLVPGSPAEHEASSSFIVRSFSDSTDRHIFTGAIRYL